MCLAFRETLLHVQTIRGIFRQGGTSSALYTFDNFHYKILKLPRKKLFREKKKKSSVVKEPDWLNYEEKGQLVKITSFVKVCGWSKRLIRVC